MTTSFMFVFEAISAFNEPTLDYCVALAAGVEVTLGKYYDDVIVYHAPFDGRPFNPSTTWNVGGPIMHQAGIGTTYLGQGIWHAHCAALPDVSFKGSTPLDAAMRCFVAKHFGTQLPELPEQLRKMQLA